MLLESQDCIKHTTVNLDQLNKHATSAYFGNVEMPFKSHKTLISMTRNEEHYKDLNIQIIISTSFCVIDVYTDNFRN